MMLVEAIIITRMLSNKFLLSNEPLETNVSTLSDPKHRETV